MPEPTENKEPKENPAAGSSPEKGDQDVDFEEELKNLESGEGDKPAAPPGKTPEQELRQAEYNLTSTAKRVKELGGDPAAIVGGAPAPAPAAQPVDTTRFVTKDDLAAEKARAMARSEGEFKVIMWHVRNKGLSVEDAHLLANKGRVRTALSEIQRKQSAVPSRGGGGPGEAAKAADSSEPVMPDAATLERLRQSGMSYDPAQKAFVGKKSALSWVPGKGWISGKVLPDRK